MSIFLIFNERTIPNGLSYQNGHVGSQKMALDLYDGVIFSFERNEFVTKTLVYTHISIETFQKGYN
jgi:hypothetical protein